MAQCELRPAACKRGWDSSERKKASPQAGFFFRIAELLLRLFLLGFRSGGSSRSGSRSSRSSRSSSHTGHASHAFHASGGRGGRSRSGGSGSCSSGSRSGGSGSGGFFLLTTGGQGQGGESSNEESLVHHFPLSIESEAIAKNTIGLTKGQPLKSAFQYITIHQSFIWLLP